MKPIDERIANRLRQPMTASDLRRRLNSKPVGQVSIRVLGCILDRMVREGEVRYLDRPHPEFRGVKERIYFRPPLDSGQEMRQEAG